MVGVFSANVDGIYVVLSTPTQVVTYLVEKGIPTCLGEGDFHDPQFDSVKREGIITSIGRFANASVPYTLTLYPSEKLYEMYSTGNPRIAAMGTVCIMIFTVLMFVAYDCLVRREFNAKQELLKAKRHFMRYVSHEVRTPLNSVCMGLNLMQEEMQSKLSVSNMAAAVGAGKTSSSSPDGSANAMITIDEAQAWLSLSMDVAMGAQSATNVLNDFLNYDKIESRQLTLELSILPIMALVNETTSEFVLPAQDKQIELTILQEQVNASDVTTASTSPSKKHFSPMKKNHHPLPQNKIGNDVGDMGLQDLLDQVVVGDKARLSQVVRNVISNAIKFTPKKGSITVKSTWIVATVGESTVINLQDGEKESLYQTGWIEIEVTDTGNGMTGEQLGKVFQSGVQFNANKNQKGGGSGLGLFIAKGIVDQHNGTLTAHSDGIGKGTSFVCKLPVYCKPTEREIENYPVAPRDESCSERVSSSWLDEVNERDLSYRILVVDDAPMNRKLLTRLLLKRGHHVDMAEDGLEAYEKVVSAMKEGKRYDTILMDYQMPVMDGPTSTQKIREEGCDSFIVGITGNVLPQDVAHFKNSGADGVLGKPFQVEELESLWIEYGVTS
jgi:signal transduction histidine kinase/ActR/RegA family two-component response regulator